MILNMSSGGGSELNFSIVGGTAQPTNPKENTIWVNTDAEITGWHFCAKEPNGNNVSLYPYSESTTTKSGVSFVDNGDGSLTATGRLSDGATYVHYYFKWAFVLPPGRYQLTGCPTAVGFNFEVWETSVRQITSGQNVSFVLTQATQVDIITSITYATDFFVVFEPKLYCLENGVVWFATGAGSNTEFEALKKNGIMVYPLSAKLYSGGAWSNKSAKIYQGGEWTDFWDGYLYYWGSAAYDEITGGWSRKDYTIGGWAASTNCGKNGNELYCVGSQGSPGMIGTVKPINLTNYDILSLWGHTTVAQEASRLYVSRTKEVVDTCVASVSLPTGDNKTLTLDVSGLTGEYYIAFGASANYNASSYASEIWLT